MTNYDKWYEKNKDLVADKKRKKYKDDAEYREQIKARARSVYKLKSNVDEDGYLVHTAVHKGATRNFYKMSRLLEESGISRGALATMINNGVIPEVYHSGKQKLFTLTQIRLVGEYVSARKATTTPESLGILGLVKARILQQWWGV